MSQTLIEFGDDNQYLPDEVTPPGETLQEVLSDRGITQTELAARLGMAHKTVNEIITGKAPLSHETALALEHVLGISASFWNNYESAYRDSLARRSGLSRLSNSLAWLESLPYKEAERLGWIPQRRSAAERVSEVLRFLGLASPDQYDAVYGELVVQFRQSSAYGQDEFARAFWLRRAELLATDLGHDAEIQWNDYDANLFESNLVMARSLTRDREPSSFVPRLTRLCADAGVAVVFVPELKGVRAGGATRWLSPRRALIQLSLHQKRNDHLWFTFFHEAGHVIKHSKRRLFVEADGNEPDGEEREANEFAENLLISRRDFDSFVRQGRPTKASVEAFAERIGIDPGIVVGRLQNENVIPRNWFNDLKQAYEWE